MANEQFYKHRFVSAIDISHLISVFYMNFEENQSVPGEVHDFWEIVYMDNGQAMITARNSRGEDTEIQLNQSEIYFHQPGEFHRIRNDRKAPIGFFVATFVCNSPAMSFFVEKKLSITPQAKALINRILRESLDAFDLPYVTPGLDKLMVKPGSQFGAQQMIRIYLEELLILLFRENEKAETMRSHHIKNINTNNHLAAFIANRIKDNIYIKFSLQDICDATHYGKTHVSNIFKSATGMSIHRYYDVARISEAKHLLVIKGNSVAQVAEKLQFTTPQYFARVFKRETGQTPSEFRKSPE